MKRPVVMILLAGALTLSMIAPSALPAVAGNVSVVHAAVKKSNDVTAETSSDEDAGEWKDKTETVYVDANADGSAKKITVKDWLRRQIDEEQSLTLPTARLAPGRRVRLQIRRGLSGELHTVEITLPPDFAVGKPVRLRGLGKRVGPWQGDLYLTLYNE